MRSTVTSASARRKSSRSSDPDMACCVEVAETWVRP
jgi:hypothetical protein